MILSRQRSKKVSDLLVGLANIEEDLQRTCGTLTKRTQSLAPLPVGHITQARKDSGGDDILEDLLGPGDGTGMEGPNKRQRVEASSGVLTLDPARARGVLELLRYQLQEVERLPGQKPRRKEDAERTAAELPISSLPRHEKFIARLEQEGKRVRRLRKESNEIDLSSDVESKEGRKFKFSHSYHVDCFLDVVGFLDAAMHDRYEETIKRAEVSNCAWEYT